MQLDFTLHLPRILGRAFSASSVPAPRAPGEPPFYCQRVPGGLEVRLGSHLLYLEREPQRPLERP